MRYEWGRAPDAGRWQRALPVWFVSLLVIALVSGVGLWLFRETFVWTPLQRFYLSAYARSAVASSLGIRTGRYRVLMMENRRGIRPAIDDEVVPMTSARGEATFGLSELAHQASSGRLVWRDSVYDHARLNAQLRVWIYANQTLTDLARPSLITVLVVVMAGVLLAIPKDAQGARSRRHGRRLKGPELVSAGHFNRRMRANGIAFVQRPRLPARLLGIRPALGDSARHRVEPSAHHRRLRHRQVGANSARSCVNSKTAATPPSCTTRHSNTHRSSTRQNAAM